jgi:hypothetical protein
MTEWILDRSTERITQAANAIRLEDHSSSLEIDALRQRIQDELFEKWLADATREAALDLAVVGTAG